jgi:hypothetical protein
MLKDCPPNILVTKDMSRANYELVFRRRGGERTMAFAFGGLAGLAIAAGAKVDGASVFDANGDMVYATKERTVEKVIQDVCANIAKR